MAGGIIIGRLCSPDQEHRYRLVFAFLYLQYKENGFKFSVRKVLPLFNPGIFGVVYACFMEIYGDPRFRSLIKHRILGLSPFQYPGAGQFLNLSVFFTRVISMPF